MAMYNNEHRCIYIYIKDHNHRCTIEQLYITQRNSIVKVGGAQ
jgi:hypothetical protein